MEIIEILIVKVLPSLVMPLDFKIFIENKYEYKDPLGEHIYSLQSIWLGCKHIIPPGEILNSFNEIRQILEEEKCDLFILTNRKLHLGLTYMKEDQIRLLVLSKQGLGKDFLEFIKDKYEYKDPMGEHIYSKESIWLSMKDIMPTGCIMDTYFEVWNVLDEYSCSWFKIIEY